MISSDGDFGSGIQAPRRGEEGGFPLVPTVIFLVALGFFVGIVWYAYRQTANAGPEGPVPLVRAEGGSIMVEPEEPGGMEIAHRDIDLLNGGESGPEQLLAPAEAPQTGPAVSLGAPEDGSGETIELIGSSAQPAAPARRPGQPPAPGEPTPRAAPAVAVETETLAAPSSAQSAPPLSVRPSDQAAPQPAAQAPAPADEPAAQPAPASAPTPIPPRQQRAQSASSPPLPPAAAPSPAPAAAPAPARTGSGNWWVQIGAVETEDGAEAEWRRLQRRAEGLLDSMSLTVQPTTNANGVTLYRIRTGPLAQADAAALCDGLKEKGVSCWTPRGE
jgi:cell division septation protein DedD